MFPILLSIIALAGVAVGYFLNFYAVFAALTLVVAAFIVDCRRPNPVSGTIEGKIGNSLLFFTLVVFIVSALITCTIVNRHLLYQLWDGLWQAFDLLSRLILR